MIDANAHKVSSVTGIAERRRQRSRLTGQGQLGGSLPSQKGGPDQKQKSDERRNGITWKPKQVFVFELAKDKWLAGFDRHSPKIELTAQASEGFFHQIHFTDGDATGRENDVAFLQGASQ